MKKIITLVFLLGMIIGFGQNLTKIITNNDVSFIITDQNGKLIEHIVLQTDNFKDQNFIKIEQLGEAKYVFNGETLIIIFENDISVFSVSDKFKGENVVYGYGISKRYGDFELNDVKKIEAQKLTKEIDSYDLVTLSNYNSLSSKPLRPDPEPSRCDSGGNGASQCSVDSEILGVSTGCSVTCNSGYYACCDDGNSSCKCFKTGTGPVNPSFSETKNFSSNEGIIDLIDINQENLVFKNNFKEDLYLLAFDLNGNQIINKKISDNKVNISSLKSGYYFYVIANNSNEYIKTGKFRK